MNESSLYPTVASTSRSMWGQWETILRASFIEVGEVHADSPFSILLFDNDWVRELVRVLNLANRSDF